MIFFVAGQLLIQVAVFFDLLLLERVGVASRRANCIRPSGHANRPFDVGLSDVGVRETRRPEGIRQRSFSWAWSDPRARQDGKKRGLLLALSLFAFDGRRFRWGLSGAAGER